MILTILALALTQPITTTREYADSDGDGRIISSGRYPELGPARTCWEKKSALVYWPCGYVPPVALAPASSTVETAIAPPRITTPTEPGKSNWAASRRTNLYMLRALDAYNLQAFAGYDDVRISDVRFDLARAVIYNAWQDSWPKPAPPEAGSVRGLTVERVVAVCTRYCLAAGRNSGPIVIRDFYFTGAGPVTTSTIPVGIRLADTAHDILIERGYVGNFRQEGASYSNGDGISAERGNYNVTIRNVTSEGNRDGGFDLKSVNTRLDALIAVRNTRYGYRLWGTVTAGHLTCEDNGQGCINLEKGANVTVDRLTLIGSSAIIVFSSSDAQINIRCIDRSRFTGTQSVKGGGKVTIGGECGP